MSNFSNKLKDWLWAIKQDKKAQAYLAVILVLVIVIVAGSLLYRNYQKAEPKTSANANINAATKPKEGETYRRYIDGVYTDADRANLRPFAVMIENHSSVRPQSGLSKANIVYEALAEGGITRFLAVFSDAGEIPEIGPVRSARLYYLDWASEYGALYIHCGGSPNALASIKDYNVFDVNQIGGDQGYFWRDIQKEAPHNLFTSTQLVAFAMRDKNVQREGEFEKWSFKNDLAKSDRPEGDKYLKIDFSTYSYEVEWKYDRENNVYLRYNAGEQQFDKNSNKAISAKNVIVQKVETGILDNEARLEMKTEGEGETIVFMDGKAFSGKWKKENNRTKFYDSADKEITFTAGQIWVEIVPKDKEIEYN